MNATLPVETLPAFADERIGLVFSHWLEIRHGQLVPRRQDISPGAIATCLPWVWLYRWRPERNSFQNVLAGEEILQAWAVGIQGQFIDTLFPADWQALRDRWLDQLRRPAIAYGRLGAELSPGRYKMAERLNLPLVDGEGEPYGIFGITIYDYDRGSESSRPVPPPLDVTIIPCRDLLAPP